MGIIRELIESYRALNRIEDILCEYIACDAQDKQPTCRTHVKLPNRSGYIVEYFLEKYLEYREKAKLFDKLQESKD